MRNTLAIIALMMTVWGFGQEKKLSFYDSISRRYGDYYTLGNLQVSEDGRYASVKRWYKTSRDTMLIYDRKKPGKPILQLLKKNQYFSFITSNKDKRVNRVLALGSGEAVLVDLTSLKKKTFTDVKEVAYLAENNCYLILQKNNDLKMYGGKDHLIAELSNVKSLLSDKKRTAWLIREENGTKQVMVFNGKETQTVYRTESEIKRVELAESGKHLMVMELVKNQSQIRMTFIDTGDQKVSSFELASATDLNKIKIWESGKGEAYLIDVNKTVKVDQSIPEVWYANDGNFSAKENGFTVQHQYYQWNTQRTELVAIPSDRFPMFAPLHDPRYLLAFDPYKDYKYDTRFAVLELYLYDLASQQYTKIFDHSEDVMISPIGRFILSYHHVKKQWEGRDLLSQTTFSVPNHLSSRPVYDEEDRYAYFDSKNGLWKLDLLQGHLEVVKGTEQKITSLQDYQRSHVTDIGTINSYWLENKGSAQLKIKGENNDASWMVYDQKRFKKIAGSSSNHRTDVKTDTQGKHVFSVEENYNLPSRLVYSHASSKSLSALVLDPGNTKDHQAKSVRQDIFSYHDRHGNPLKGVLYYPKDYNETQKYPMIVSIYQVQSSTANHYKFPKASTIGFDLRTLTERGYFVYLADIVYSSEGSGLSALDCVNRSLDALQNHTNIDADRIGLTGHSMGGYETIFIATQSKRFKTYIAGAAQSNVVRGYFSFNYSSGMPYMWQYENGQHYMNASFTENKEIYFKNNPIHYVDQVDAPILLWTGKKDENVRWDHTMEFYMGLMRNRKQAIALFYPDGYHNLGNDTEESRDLNKRSFEWWDYFLKDKKDISWIDQQMRKDAF